MILNYEIIASVWSDHSAVTLKLSFLPEWPRGNNFWKFNAQHLQDTVFVESMIDKIVEWKKLYSNVIDQRVKWELIK